MNKPAKYWGLVSCLVLFFSIGTFGAHSAGVKDTGKRGLEVEEIRNIEYNQINYNESGEEYYGLIKGKIPIMISAPHGARHFRTRENRWKGEDEYTASLAIKLGQLTGAHVIYVKNRAGEDPNHDLTSKYKTALAKAVKAYDIKFIIDLHGADGGRPFKVDFGTLSNEPAKSSCPTFRETIHKAFSDFEPECFNRHFGANGVGTITYFARNKLGIEAAQVEINARYRIVERKPDSAKAKSGNDPHFKADRNDVLELVKRLERMIHEINMQIKNT